MMELIICPVCEIGCYVGDGFIDGSDVSVIDFLSPL